MERKHFTVSRNFFKFMTPGFHQKLKLPPAISKEVQEVKQQSGVAILESQIGTWKISMCRNNENDLICFDQGWPQFVHRHALAIGDLLLFELTANDLHFNVTVFDSSACEKMFKEKEQPNDALIPVKMSSIGEAEEGIPYFEKTMVPHLATPRPSVSIPIKFMRSNNLGRQTSVILRDPRGRKWAVEMSSEKKHGLHLRMYKGWSNFYASNALKDGDVCVFRLQRRLLTHTTTFFDVQISRARS